MIGMVLCESCPMRELSGWELSELEMTRKELFGVGVVREGVVSLQIVYSGMGNILGWHLSEFHISACHFPLA